MTGLSLGIGLRGLRAAQAALDTVGHNLSNANTPGYSRQRLDLDSSLPTQVRGLMVGTGVDTNGIRRVSDALLNNRIRSQVSLSSSLNVQLQGMSRIEDLVFSAGENGLGGLFDNFFGAVSALSANTSDGVLQNGMVQAGGSVAEEFNQLDSFLTAAKEDNLQEIRFHVDEVNRITQSVLLLNQEVMRVEGGGANANDLRDRRDQELRNLAEQVDITFKEVDSGAVVVSIQGRVVVGSQYTNELSMDLQGDGAPVLMIEGSDDPLPAQGGDVGGLMRFREDFLPRMQNQLDSLAFNLALEVNRAHSTSIPESGGFEFLSSTESVGGVNDAERRLQRLGRAGLPFDVQSGELFVNVTNSETGAVRIESIDIDAERTSVQDLLDSLNAVPNMNAELDSLGRLNLYSDDGFQFDFGTRLDSNPNDHGTLGGGLATLGSSQNGPYTIGNGQTFSLQGPTGASTLTFQAADFKDIGNATAREIAMAINSDGGMTAAGIQAVDVGGRLVLQSTTSGTTETVAAMGGSAIGALGFTAGSVAQGNEDTVQIEASGRYTGSENQTLFYEPLGDGTIGSTPGLQIRVTREDGSTFATLDVGENYTPGQAMDLGDGVGISFSLGDISATNGEVFKQDLIADGDSSDLLVAFGVNSFYTGNTAQDIHVAEELASNPNRVAFSGTGASGDNGGLLRMLQLQDNDIESLGASIPGFFGQMVGNVGFEVQSLGTAANIAEGLVASLDERRESVSGVNVDEELVDLVRFEQSYSAAARYIQVVQQLNDTILNII